MTQDQAILFTIFGAFFVLLLWGRWRYDLVAFGALLAGALLGVVPADKVFAGFGHPATLIVALVLVISAGLVNSGAIGLITRHLADASRGTGAHIAIMGSLGAVLSAFINNVAALALLMPVDMQAARKAGRGPGLTLMALSFATILGGMVTLIGTPPNIIIATIRKDAFGEPFGMFDFAPVGLVTASIGLLFVATVGWRLIPKHLADVPDDADSAEPGDYVAELVVGEKSALIGRTLADLAPEADSAEVSLVGLVRGGRRQVGAARRSAIEAGDALVVEAAPDALEEFRTTLKLDFDADRATAAAGRGLVEVVVPLQARIAGKSALAVGLLWRQGVTLVGISRQGRRIRQRVRRTVIKPGDILLLLGPTDRLDDVAGWLGGLPLAERGLTVTQDGRAWWAIAAFGAGILAASLGYVSLPVAIAVVVGVYVISKIVPLADVYDHVEWPVVVLLGSMIPLGTALDTSGGTALIAGQLLAISEGLPSWAILAMLMAVTMTLSDILNNTATTIVAAPIAIEMADGLGVNADPFLMAVAVAASCAFLTPIGHKNNTLILGPGGYRFGDYWPMGLPLEVLILVTGVPAILFFWPL